MRIKKAMSANDRAKLGHHANSIARWELLQRIHSCNRASKIQIRKITAGLGRKTHIKKLQEQLPQSSISMHRESPCPEPTASPSSILPLDACADSPPPQENAQPEVKYDSFNLDLE